MDGKWPCQGDRFAPSVAIEHGRTGTRPLRLYLDALQGQHRVLPGFPGLGRPEKRDVVRSKNDSEDVGGKNGRACCADALDLATVAGTGARAWPIFISGDR